MRNSAITASALKSCAIWLGVYGFTVAMLDLMIGLIFLTFLILVVTVLVFVYISGISTPMEFAVSSNIPYLNDGATFYYKPYKGSYTSVGPVFTEAYAITPKVCQCGLYYDDPDNETPDNCRAAIGVLLDDGSEEDISALESNGFKKFHIPPIKEALYATFPHISFLSIFIGIFKALPLLRKCFKVNVCFFSYFIPTF